ncbi:hypothetical protein PGTUg99_018270 [Puccinia graminis f. sp. tritici]|uniref:Uncharacterized protein n=1 Tax=Puccinia graminis f. sp. tritici TaxID=56615 RepID=A0A5B0M1Y6_PUCGR|nr:hypothetical protein PGTUg99_018270 [Puccinia graminis f. sp. tritici]
MESTPHQQTSSKRPRSPSSSEIVGDILDKVRKGISGKLSLAQVKEISDGLIASCVEETPIPPIARPNETAIQRQIIEKGYSEDYQNTDEIVKPILETLDRLSNDWSIEYLAPYTSLIGPSMIGKTRLIMELAKHVCVIYICLRPVGSTGYPPRSALAGPILVDKVDYITLSTAIFEVAAEFFNKQGSINASKEDRLKEWNRYCKPPAEKFSTDVCAKMQTLPLPKEDEIVTLKEPVHKLQQATQFIGRSGLTVLLAIDEARELLVDETTSRVSRFRLWRRALATVPYSSGFFALVADTTSQVSNFSASVRNDSSARPRPGEDLLFAPIYNLATMDLMCTNHSPATWEDLLAKDRLFSYGCPFFGMYIRCAKSAYDPDRVVEELIAISEAKLLCRSKTEPGANELSESRIFALLGSTIQPQIYMASRLNSDLVSSHAAHCLYIDQARERIVADYPSQFAFSTAANGFIASDDARLIACIEHLASVLRQGLISSGDAGELASRIILLRAMQQTMQKVVPRPKKAPINYLHSVPLVDFLTTLTGLEKDELELGAISETNKDRLLDEGHIFWNHFINIKYTPGSYDFLQFLHRGLAVQCKPMQRGFDQLFSIYLKQGNNPKLKEDDVTFCGVRVKNAISKANLKKQSPKWTTKSAKIGLSKPNPYLVILLDFSGKIQEHDLPDCGDESQRRGTLLLFGLRKVGCLTPEITKALEKLISIDPDVSTFSRDPQLQTYVKAVLPCTYPVQQSATGSNNSSLTSLSDQSDLSEESE